MRKLLSIVLCLVMVFCFTVPAMAATSPVELEGDSDSFVDKKVENIPVNVEIIGNPVYQVVVEWDDMTFNYNAGAWDPETLSYAQNAWVDEDVSITVTNRSNAGVNVTSSLVANAEVYGLTVTPDKTTFPLATAENCDESSLPNDTFTYTVSGTPDDESIRNFEYGKVTITVAKA